MHATPAHTRYTEATYALMRFVLGALFLCHGVQKLFGAFGEPAAGKPLMMAGGVIELLAGLLIALGLMTRAAAFIASGEMAVAYLMSHAPKGLWPIANGGEKAVLYCFAFLFMAAYGGGAYSLDAVFRRAPVDARETDVVPQVTAAAPRV